MAGGGGWVQGKEGVALFEGPRARELMVLVPVWGESPRTRGTEGRRRSMSQPQQAGSKTKHSLPFCSIKALGLDGDHQVCNGAAVLHKPLIQILISSRNTFMDTFRNKV